MHAASPAARIALADARAASTRQSGSLPRARWSSTTARRCWSLCALLTLCWAVAATRLTLNASFEKMIPRSHPYIQNYLENRAELRGLGNSLRIVVENPKGDIYDPSYLETLQEDQRRALPHARRRPRLDEVAVGARRALDRGDRGRLPRRPGDARQLRRLAAADRAAARQHRALRHRRQPGRQRLQVQHDRRAAAGPATRRPASASTTARCRTRSRRSAPRTRADGDAPQVARRSASPSWSAT